MAECEELATRVAAGDLVASERHALYRRVLSEAWRTDLRLDGSELSILGVLRRELRLTQADHFLVVEHPDVEPFWRTSDPLGTVLDQLRSNGILFLAEGDVVLPIDLVPWVREALGVSIEDDGFRRLLAEMPNSVLRQGLNEFGLRTSDSKSMLIDRIVRNFLPPQRILQLMHIHDLKGLASSSGAKKSGTKDDVVERLVAHYRDGLDLAVHDPEHSAEPTQETKQLNRTDFEALFGSLKSLELSAILIKEPSLPGSGNKARRVAVLWDHHLNEASLLGHLGGERLRLILDRLGLKTSGSKPVRIERIVAHFAAHGRLRDAAKGVNIVLRQPSDPPPLNRARRPRAS